MTAQLATARIGFCLSALLGARKADDPLPRRLQLFKLGTNETSQGPFIVTEANLASLPAFQRRIGRERVPIGFEHNLDEGSPEYLRTTEPRPRAAKGATVVGVPGKGIFLDDIEWTPLGAQKIGDYEDLSPTPLYDKETRHVLGIMSASLVSAGAGYGMTLDNAATARLSALLDDEDLAAQALTGLDRVVAAFDRENRQREQREKETVATLASAAVDPDLHGMDRTIAAFQKQNERHPEFQRLSAIRNAR